MTDLRALAATLSTMDAEASYPVLDWHPSRCGDIDIVIREDGVWIHEGSPIGRAALVHLFSRLLRKDPEGYVLVTPVELLSITVEDVPFLIVGLDLTDSGVLVARTNVGELLEVGPDHPLRMAVPSRGGAPVPYINVRHGLDARFNRSTYYELVEHATLSDEEHLVVQSGPHAFSLGPTAECS